MPVKKNICKTKKCCKKKCHKICKKFKSLVKSKKHKKTFYVSCKKACKSVCSKKVKKRPNKRKTNRRRFKQHGGMIPTPLTNLGHSIVHSANSFVSTLIGIPHPVNPLPFKGHFL